VVVRPDAADGRIRVSTFNDIVGEGAVLGAGFIVPPPDFDCIGPETSRSVTLRVVRSLAARGAVSADNGFTACAASVPVKIQRRVAGEWKTVKDDHCWPPPVPTRGAPPTRPAGTGPRPRRSS
jgi:hypothetical protein